LIFISIEYILAIFRSAVDLIIPEALTHPFIHLEDVFLTGIIAEMTNVPRRLAVEFRNNAVPIPGMFNERLSHLYSTFDSILRQISSIPK